MMTAYPLAAKSCFSKSNSFVYCDAGPPCNRSSVGIFPTAPCGLTRNPSTSVPSLLLNFVSLTGASLICERKASFCFVRQRKLFSSAAKISYGRSGVLARTMTLPFLLTSYAVTVRRPPTTVSVALPAAETRTSVWTPLSSSTTKTDFPSGDQCG